MDLQHGLEIFEVVRIGDQVVGVLVELGLDGLHVGLGDVVQQFAEQHDPLGALVSQRFDQRRRIDADEVDIAVRTRLRYFFQLSPAVAAAAAAAT